MTRRPSLRFFLGLCACLSLPLVLAAQFPPAPAIGFVWDLANTLGFLALAACLLLFAYPGRPRAFPPFNGRFFANMHRHLGYLALALLAGHIGPLLYAEPLLWQHLKLSAPGYMLAGLAAAVMMTLLVISSITPLRRRIWADYHRFRALHALLALACLGSMLWHVIGSRYYLNTPVKLLVAAAGCVGVVAHYLHRRRLHHRDKASITRIRGTGGTAYTVSYGSTAVLVVLALLLVGLRLAE